MTNGDEGPQWNGTTATKRCNLQPRSDIYGPQSHVAALPTSAYFHAMAFPSSTKRRQPSQPTLSSRRQTQARFRVTLAEARKREMVCIIVIKSLVVDGSKKTKAKDKKSKRLSSRAKIEHASLGAPSLLRNWSLILRRNPHHILRFTDLPNYTTSQEPWIIDAGRLARYLI